VAPFHRAGACSSASTALARVTHHHVGGRDHIRWKNASTLHQS
jgi:hypothetical protein